MSAPLRTTAQLLLLLFRLLLGLLLLLLLCWRRRRWLKLLNLLKLMKLLLELLLELLSLSLLLLPLPPPPPLLLRVVLLQSLLQVAVFVTARSWFPASGRSDAHKIGEICQGPHGSTGSVSSLCICRLPHGRGSSPAFASSP